MTPTCYIGVNKTFFNLLVNDTENVNIIQTTTIQVVKPKPIVGNSRKLKKPNIDINEESFIFVYLKSGFVQRECHIYGLEHRAGFFDDTENFKNIIVCH